MKEDIQEIREGGIILFDGVCNLCNGAIQWIIPRDPKGYFRFASLQSDVGKALLEKHSIESLDLSSMVLIDHSGVSLRSTAALKIAQKLNSPAKALALFLVFPSVFRDPVYRLVAKYRYRWFGRTESCALPTPEIKRRFLDNVEASVLSVTP